MSSDLTSLGSKKTTSESVARFREQWNLDSDVTFINHGSFGACPKLVLEYQHTLRLSLEQQPVKFLARELESRLDQARSSLAVFLHANPEQIVFVPNATTGINAVLRSYPLQPGDELLTTNQEYNACRNVLNYVADRAGAKINVATIPYPIESPEQATEAISAAVTPKTKLALLDHVVSQTGLVLPIQAIIAHLSDRGIETLIDGAHAPGMLPIDLQTLGATYYTGNCHKWLCAPKGAAFLYVQADKIAQVRPTTISHGANDPRAQLPSGRSRFHLEFDWMGTGDPTAYLSVPWAIDFMGTLLPGGWPQLMAHNCNGAIAGRRHLCEILQTEPNCPETMIGALASVQLSDGDAEELYAQLWQIAQIEVPIVPFPVAPARLVRISSQIYNSIEEYRALGVALTGFTQSK